MLLLFGCAPADILGPDPAAAEAVHLLTPAGDGWTDAGAVAHSFSSLHAVILGDELLVAGLAHDRPPTWWEERFPRLFVDVLATSDLETWTVRRLDVDASGRSMIDPALVSGPDGLELWFVQMDGLGDPAQAGRAGTIVRTRFDGTGFGAAEAWGSGAGLVDPSPVWWRGAWRVYATRDRRDVVEVTASGARVVLGGATVPFATSDGEGLVLLAQTMVGGAMRPVRATSADGSTWSAASPVAVTGALRTCTSPVTATLSGSPVLLCVDERPR